MGFVWSAEMKYCIGGYCRTRCKKGAACKRRLTIIGHGLLILKAELPGHAPIKRPLATTFQLADLVRSWRLGARLHGRKRHQLRI
jgi:hypothetical protein